MRALRETKQTSGISKHTEGRQRKVVSKTQRTKLVSSAGAAKLGTRESPKPKKVAARSQKKKKVVAPRTEAQYSAKPEKFKETWDRVIATVAKMRADKLTLTEASRAIGIDSRTVKRWGGSALRKRNNGTLAAKPYDNLLRLVLIPMPEGPREIAVRGSKQVKVLAEYWNALHRYFQTGDARKLKIFEGKQIKDANGVAIPLSVDLSALNRLGSAGVLSFESIYARSA
jgi:hypothetical protein